MPLPDKKDTYHSSLAYNKYDNKRNNNTAPYHDKNNNNNESTFDALLAPENLQKFQDQAIKRLRAKYEAQIAEYELQIAQAGQRLDNQHKNFYDNPNDLLAKARKERVEEVEMLKERLVVVCEGVKEAVGVMRW